MPSFDTPDPITVTAYVYSGSIRFTAGDRSDTVVDVTPQDPKRDQDVRAADQTEVAFASGVLTVRTPKANLVGRSGNVDVTVGLPAGSHVDTSGAGVQVLGEGLLGEVRVKSSAGDVRLDATGPLHVTAQHGLTTVERVDGPAEITTSTGNLRVGVVNGPATLKNAHGTTTVGTVTGELRVSSSHGGVDITHARSSVTGTTTHGHIRVAEVARGTVRLETSNGSMEIGIREGTAAWLDISSTRGQVRNTLAPSEAPERNEETAEVRARTNWGNVDVFRARA
ncbi:DUF4097 family beta strand repeat-containing protein [Streptomyces bacillaris]|uniref:DUF4097 family beta strand repeat-containing protein n=1 Tax=Streptomyces bacillaris TaxID=68179 RepID=UPI0034602DA4